MNDKDKDNDFDNLIAKHDINRKFQLDILEIVKKFFIERELILYGGQALDYALRVKGDKIYEEYQIPDYDMFSSNHVQDAYDLVDILKQHSNYNMISAINARHIQTMKVRVNGYFVADISYLPESIFNYYKKNSIKYQNMLLRYPVSQIQDMYLSLGEPYKGDPLPNYKNRYKKDTERMNLYMTYYPIPKTNIISKQKYKKTTIKIDKPMEQVLHGFCAYSIYVYNYNKIINKSNLDLSIEMKSSKGETKYIITFESPSVRPNIMIASLDSFIGKDKVSTLEWHNSYIDHIPIRAISDKLEYHIIPNHQTPVHLINYNKMKFQIVNIYTLS